MKVKDSQLHACFFKFTENNSRKVKCKFCGHKSAENVTRMRQHINSCGKGPQDQARALSKPTPTPDSVVPSTSTGVMAPPQNHVLDVENTNITSESDSELESSSMHDTGTAGSTIPATVASANASTSKSALAGTSVTFNAKRNVKIEKFFDRMSTEEQEKADTMFARAAYSSGLPLSFTENEHVQEFFAFMRPSWKPPSRYLLSGPLLNVQYKKSMTDVKSVIDSADVLAVVTDGWTNVNMKPIINFILTTPTPIFVKSIETGDNEHTGDYIAKQISDVIINYSPSKILAVVSDNASAMRKAWEFITFQFPHIYCYGCSAHVFNLLAQDICKMKSAATVISTANRVIKFFKYRQIPRAVLERVHAETDLGCGVHALVLPVATRWGSNTQALKRLLHMKNALQKAVVDKKLEKLIRAGND